MELNLDEALRYLGAKSQAPEQLRADVAATAKKLTSAVQPRYTYRVCALHRTNQGFLLPEVNLLLPGADAARMLAQCDQAVLLACTLGAQFETLLRAEQARDMAKAVILDACGSAWVEAGCDQVESELAVRLPGRYLTDRFSPGYGDLPLSLQPEICAVLDTPRRLGLHVTEHFLMNPSKSVTAIIGLSDHPQTARIRGCAHCFMRETCALRKGGKHCAN
ncbi:methionine synthase [Clostridiaceae bacterium NSJ-31]|uniref:Methionine synthase n=1 Tax=Ligaoa zhengdingensis TaxID=2763658 RepID=A0A926DXZ4_9FIRM|nr:methionine synthase [Ligaoa zhengdingensis]